jgi:polyisoprenyl-phosphate glycosyltransferase
MPRKFVSIVISAFNEEGNIRPLYEQIIEHMPRTKLEGFELIWVNDGSADSTLEECRKLVAIDGRCKVVNLTRNRGHEIAMTAGMDHATGDCVLFMDADLQHPAKYIPKLIALWQNGMDIVLTKRVANREESRRAKIMGLLYYKLLNFLSDIPIPSQSPDFRLIDRKYVTVLQKMDEGERMFRGLLNWIGISNCAVVKFIAPKRLSGKTKYNFRKSLGLAIDGILQFSTRPLRLATYIGLLAIVFVSVIGAFTLWEYFVKGVAQNGYSTAILTIVFVSSIQLVFLGIIGEYIGRIHLEVKKRPLYFAEFITHEQERDAGN